MSAKHPKKPGPRTPPAPTASVPPAASGGAVAAAPAEAASWIESGDPRKRALGKIVLIAVWLYVAALWLLALDQTFNWGIFGAKMPPMP